LRKQESEKEKRMTCQRDLWMRKKFPCEKEKDRRKSECERKDLAMAMRVSPKGYLTTNSRICQRKSAEKKRKKKREKKKRKGKKREN